MRCRVVPSPIQHATSQPHCLPFLQLPDGRKIRSVHVAASIKAPPAGKGIWGAAWMNPVQMKYGAWPASGEVGRWGNQQECGGHGAGRASSRLVLG